MATVIDTLLVALGFELTDFKKGQKEAQEGLKKTSEESAKRAKEIEAKAKVMAEAYKKVRQEVIGMIGALVSTSAIKSFVERVVTTDAATKRLADNLGVSIEKLTAWQALGKQFGGSAEDIAGAFQNINRIVQGLATGTGGTDAIAPLTKLLGGEDLAVFISRATTAEERMKLLQRAIARAPNRQNALTWAQQAGFTEQTFTVMKEINDKLDELLPKAEKAAAVTEEQGEMAKRLATAWNEAYQAVENFGRAILYTVTPALEAVLNRVKEFFSGVLGKKLFEFLNLPQESTGSPESDAEYDRRLGAAKFAPKSGRRSGKASVAPAAAPPVIPGLPSPPKDPAGDERNVSSAVQRERDAFAAQLISRELARAQTADPKLRPGLQRELDAIANFGTTGRRFTPADYTRSLLSNISSASRSGAKPSGSPGTTEVNVGTVNVTTQATDANGIARDIVGALQANYSLATQSAQGLR